MSRTEYLLASFVLRLLGRLFSLSPIVPDRVVLASPRMSRLEGNLGYVHDALLTRHPGLRPIVSSSRTGSAFAARSPQLAGRRVVLHAPTLRGRGSAKTSAAALDPALLRARLPAEFALVLKPHPSVVAASLPAGGYDALIDPAEEMNAVLALTGSRQPRVR